MRRLLARAAIVAGVALLGVDNVPTSTPEPLPGNPAFTTDATQPVTLPMRFVDRPLVQGTVNGHALWFHLDTGASTFAIGAADAKLAGLTVDPATKRTEPVDFTLGPVHAPAARFFVLPSYGFDDGGYHVAGLLGAPLLYSFVVTIDYPNETVTIFPSGTFDPATTGVQPTTLVLHDREGYVNVCFKETCGWFLVDTGAQITQLSLSFARRVGLAPPSGTIRVTGGVGSQDEPIYPVPDMVVAGVRVRTERVAAGDFGQLPGSGILGRDILSHFTLTLDWHDGLAYFAPARRK